jgi:7-cyano-7-deazaguanine synthase
MKTIAIVSGGMDSVCLAYYLKAQGHELHFVSVDYGQRHAKEIEFAAVNAQKLDAKHSTIDMTSITKLIATSSLTSNQDVPDGHYAEETMKATVVPNRNMMMLSVATAIAISEDADYVATGVHGGDHFIYPDCRTEFIQACSAAAMIGMVGISQNFKGIISPFIHHDKAWIAKTGDELGVDWQQTWSCYKGGNVHCGRCGTCVERAEAFWLAGVQDPTEYQDTTFWREQVGA